MTDAELAAVAAALLLLQPAHSDTAPARAPLPTPWQLSERLRGAEDARHERSTSGVWHERSTPGVLSPWTLSGRLGG